MLAEGYLMQGQTYMALELLSRRAEDVEEYIDRNCPTTDNQQWFSFSSPFDRLAYQVVERDPRELRDVGEPLDRLYADLALARMTDGDTHLAIEALKQAVRWNPMACEHRLNLAELCRDVGDISEYLALSHSVLIRASEPSHLIRAFLSFAKYFQASGKSREAAALLRAARRVDASDPLLRVALDQAVGTQYDPDVVSDEEEGRILDELQLPRGANAQVVICLLQCALDARELGDQDAETRLMLRARALAGTELSHRLMGGASRMCGACGCCRRRRQRGHRGRARGGSYRWRGVGHSQLPQRAGATGARIPKAHKKGASLRTESPVTTTR